MPMISKRVSEKERSNKVSSWSWSSSKPESNLLSHDTHAFLHVAARQLTVDCWKRLRRADCRGGLQTELSVVVGTCGTLDGGEGQGPLNRNRSWSTKRRLPNSVAKENDGMRYWKRGKIRRGREIVRRGEKEQFGKERTQSLETDDEDGTLLTSGHDGKLVPLRSRQTRPSRHQDHCGRGLERNLVVLSDSFSSWPLWASVHWNSTQSTNLENFLGNFFWKIHNSLLLPSLFKLLMSGLLAECLICISPFSSRLSFCWAACRSFWRFRRTDLLVFLSVANLRAATTMLRCRTTSVSIWLILSA